MALAILASLALAESSATSFATDAGDWEGGSLGDGVLVVTESTTLALDQMASFTLTARVRLADGDGFSLLAGESVFDADYTGAERLSLDSDTAPFPASELDFDAESTVADNLADPDLARLGDELLLCGTRDGGLVLSRDPGADFDDFASIVANAAEPDLLVGTELHVYFSRDGAIHRATSADGESFSEDGEVLAPGADFDSTGLGSPSVVIDDAGTYHLYYSVPATGASGYATSADGLAFTRMGELSAGSDRLWLADVSYDNGTFSALYSMGDSLGLALGGTDPTLADDDTDIRPLVEADQASWADDGFGAPTLLFDNDALYTYVAATDEGEAVIGEIEGEPEPGTWVTLVLDWDGSNLVARWNDVELASSATGIESFTFTVDGSLEIDEVEVEYTTISDTGVIDTGILDTEDSGLNDDTGTPTALDSADTGAAFPGYNAGEWLGDPGGCGCNSTAPSPAVFSLGWLLLLRRVRGGK
ncbi:MAG: hypothetical protein FJ102_00260 [Deltaproteobacteria bacterium]|nr:hypothetical protein [Deltaproteobacteria bacterium]